LTASLPGLNHPDFFNFQLESGAFAAENAYLYQAKYEFSTPNNNTRASPGYASSSPCSGKPRAILFLPFITAFHTEPERYPKE